MTRKLSERSLSSGSRPRCRFILSAVCQVRMMTSPTRPIAWLSDDIMLKAPRSCRMSSAAIVSRRMRLSANATSSGMRGSRWWHTINISRCSSTVLTVNGRVGLVEDGKTLGSPHSLMMSGAWPPPAPSVWKAWMLRPLKAAIVFSTKPDSLSVSVWMATAMSNRSATPRQVSMAAAVVRLLDQLWADQMDMRIDAARGDDAPLAGDGLGSRSDHDVDPGLDIRVAGLADAADAAVADADIGFDDAPVVEDHGIGDDGVDRTLATGCLALAHAVADDLAAAELNLLAIDRAITLDLDDELGVGQTQPIPGRRAEHRGIGIARYLYRHRVVTACR